MLIAWELWASPISPLRKGRNALKRQNQIRIPVVKMTEMCSGLPDLQPLVLNACQKKANQSEQGHRSDLQNFIYGSDCSVSPSNYRQALENSAHYKRSNGVCIIPKLIGKELQPFPDSCQPHLHFCFLYPSHREPFLVGFPFLPLDFI